jgi:HlyD family secretion protein
MTAYYHALIAVEESNIAQLEREISNSTVAATIDGTVTQLFAKNANIASSASPIAEITVPGNNIEVFVSTQDINSIRLGDVVDLTLKQRGEDIAFTGSVISVENRAEIRYSALGVEERKVKVLIAPDLGNIETALGIGFAVDVRFLLYREEGKFIVPKTALFKENREDRVWVVRDGVANSHGVLTGMELRTHTVVESGLVLGDFVVSDANNQSLRNGVRVEP